MSWYRARPSLGLLLIGILAVCCEVRCQGLPRDAASLLSASSAAQSLARALQRAEQWRQEAKVRPSGACNTGAASLCAPRTSAADDSALLLATSPGAFDLRDPKQTGGCKVLTPVLDQLECNTCTAFAVGAAAETALAIGLKKDAVAWFSPQDFFFCSSLSRTTERTCRSSWLMEPALTALAGAIPTKPDCLTYAPLANKPCAYKCRDINPDVPTGRFVYARLTSEVDMQQWMRLKGAVLSSMQVYPDLFKFLKAQPNGLYKGPGADAKIEDSYGHAVVLVGYDNRDSYWVVRSSWGPKVGTEGYFKVSYGASGIADASNTWGLRFAPLKPAPAYSANQISSTSQKGCYDYKASSDDYFGKVADKFGVSVKQLALDNLESVKDPAASLGGHTIKVCNAQEVADVLPPKSQADALLRIKAAIDPNNRLTGYSLPGRAWIVQQPNQSSGFCTWAGITCDSSGNVVRILLNAAAIAQKLGGVLPEADLLLALPKLTELKIEQQNLVGTLPESYSKLTQLQVISLIANKLRGTLPASWSGMKSLQQLALGTGTQRTRESGNLLVGTLPPEWGAMANLRQLSLATNELTGQFPREWGALQLEELQLGNNQLTGTIPQSWTPLVVNHLHGLVMQSNRVTGSLSPEWGSAKYLRQLKLDYNKLHGPIPFSWRKMPSLTELNLGANELTGTLPGQWDSAALTTMYLGENRLTDALPAWPAPNLKIFHVGQFYGGVCAGNKLSGTISPHLPTLMPHLTMLMLPCNNLSGTIPPELGSLEQLKTFSVGQNPGIHGTLPASMGKLSKLTWFDVSDTNIQGTVPDAYGALTALQGLVLGHTKLSGCIPASMAGLNVMSGLPGWQMTSGITGICSGRSSQHNGRRVLLE